MCCHQDLAQERALVPTTLHSTVVHVVVVMLHVLYFVQIVGKTPSLYIRDNNFYYNRQEAELELSLIPSLSSD